MQEGRKSWPIRNFIGLVWGRGAGADETLAKETAQAPIGPIDPSQKIY
ncbi:hypothetical protein B0G74_4261 [Paraburkholderia sp. BL9I2N2]|jgi:hypothetical protein|nr:hypothetical protein B0G74_4261 [Paraburkholderia sp. BL9I2N2]